MIRKHNRRAAKAAFAIALGVAHRPRWSRRGAGRVSTQATPIIVGTKNFPEQYLLGQLYKQALEAKGFEVQYKENIGSTELIDTALAQRPDHAVSRVHGDHALGHVQAEDAAEDRARRRTRWRSGCTRSAGRRCSGRRRSRTWT